MVLAARVAGDVVEAFQSGLELCTGNSLTPCPPSKPARHPARLNLYLWGARHCVGGVLDFQYPGQVQGVAKRPTLAVRRQEMASFLTSSMVGSRCVLYLARGCHLSYCAWRFFPAQHIAPSHATTFGPLIAL